MIRRIVKSDKNSITEYLANKLHISLPEAMIKAKKIIKSGHISFLKDDKDVTGICYVEKRQLGDKQENFVEILTNHWRLAEAFIQCLRWQLNGICYFSLFKHDSLNRTLNKNGIRFLKCEGDRNIYWYKFEKINFQSFKIEDNED